MNSGGESKRRNRLRPDILFSTLLKIVGVMSWVVISIPILWLLIPIRWMNPFLRKLGIQNSKLPSDLIQKWWNIVVVWILHMNV